MKITKQNYEKEVSESSVPVVLDFWAEWCGPCRMLAPVIEELEKEYAGKIKFGKVNVDEEPELAEMFDVMSIPMLAAIKDKTVKGTSVGYKTKEELCKFFDGMLI